MRKGLEAVDPEALVQGRVAFEAADGAQGVAGALVEGVGRLRLEAGAHQGERVEQRADGEHVGHCERVVLALVDHGPLDVVQACSLCFLEPFLPLFVNWGR